MVEYPPPEALRWRECPPSCSFLGGHATGISRGLSVPSDLPRQVDHRHARGHRHTAVLAHQRAPACCPVHNCLGKPACRRRQPSFGVCWSREPAGGVRTARRGGLSWLAFWGHPWRPNCPDSVLLGDLPWGSMTGGPRGLWDVPVCEGSCARPHALERLDPSIGIFGPRCVTSVALAKQTHATGFLSRASRAGVCPHAWLCLHTPARAGC